MNLGKDEKRSMGQGCAETNAARRAPLRATGTPSGMAVGRSGASCSAVLQGRQTECGGDGLSSRSPGGQTQCAGPRAEGIRDQSRMAATRHEARGNAREPDGGNAGTH